MLCFGARKIKKKKRKRGEPSPGPAAAQPRPAPPPLPARPKPRPSSSRSAAQRPACLLSTRHSLTGGPHPSEPPQTSRPKRTGQPRRLSASEPHANRGLPAPLNSVPQPRTRPYANPSCSRRIPQRRRRTRRNPCRCRRASLCRRRFAKVSPPLHSPRRAAPAGALASPSCAANRRHGELPPAAHGATAARPTLAPAPVRGPPWTAACCPRAASPLDPAHAAASARPADAVHRGPRPPCPAPPVHSTVSWTGHSRAATWPGRPRPPRAPGLFAKKPSHFFKINPQSSAVIVSFKICPCFYSLGPAPVGFYIFNPNLFLIQI